MVRSNVTREGIPVRRVTGAAAGVLLLLNALRALRRGSVLNILGGVVGAGILTRALASEEFGGIRVQRSIQVDVPVEEAFSFWKNFDRFSEFMSYVEDVGVNDTGGFRWVLCGPGGVRVRVNAEVSVLVPNQRIEWRTLPGSTIHHSGKVKFTELGAGKTNLDVELFYRVPGGLVARRIIHLLGFDPADRIDHDLLHMKELIESNSRVSQMSARSGTAGAS